MFIANATGCSSIWGGSSPSNPYTANHEGKGPAWANSLFEDNAEFGFGIHMANKQQRLGLIGKILKLIGKIEDDKGLISVLKAWIDTVDNGEASRGTSKDMLNSLMTFSAQGEVKELVEEILRLKKHFIKKSTWIFGGDGWAYDIGFGGLDHVIASGEDINILVFDTEVYSNTGGQASKSTQLGAMAKFASTGMRTAKKDLGLMAMSYGYVYVASVAMGANSAQTLKAFAEAERYKGPSIIIAYSPCIAHGIKSGGMSATQLQEKLAVDSGYLNLYRFNPELAKEGKNPLVIDSKDPSRDLKDFMDSEMRFSSLKLILPHVSDELIERAEKYSRRRLELYKKLSE
jgi:pyruvate-ferredoxin/flavodoxin oxidoreductase